MDVTPYAEDLGLPSVVIAPNQDPQHSPFPFQFRALPWTAGTGTAPFLCPVPASRGEGPAVPVARERLPLTAGRPATAALCCGPRDGPRAPDPNVHRKQSPGTHGLFTPSGTVTTAAQKSATLVVFSEMSAGNQCRFTYELKKELNCAQGFLNEIRILQISLPDE